MMKSDGDLVSVSLSSYDDLARDSPGGHMTHVSGFFTSGSTPTCVEESLKFNMVPCKQKTSAPTSPNNFLNFKESDSNGNDIRKVNLLTGQVAELQRSLSTLQEETDTTITKLRQELQDKANIVETLQQQIRMKMFMNLTTQKNPMMAALAGAQSPSGGFAGLNEEMLASWRKNIEQSLLAGAGSGVFPWTVGGQDSRVGLRTPGSPNTTRSETPHTDRQTPIDSRYPVDGSKTPSDEGRLSPAARSEDSRSPGKCEGVSPTPSPLPTPFSGQGLVPRSFANTVNTNTSSSSPSQLSIPPLFTSRIPKGDPLEERLHDMLRFNMEKFAGQPIDTLADSRRVREMLSIHNIGQRLFAKYVLGLSQGTVSELLSKPKSWDKLTEKGRDSYRKMHAWVWDEGAILLLKTLIPRKGELLRSGNSNSMKQEEDRQHHHHHSEHRINKILSEVNKTGDNLLGSSPAHAPGATHLPPSLLLPNLPHGGQASDETLKLAALSFYQNEINQLHKLPGATNPVAAASDQSETEESNQIEPEDSDKDSVKEEKENHELKEDNFKSTGPSPFSLLQAKADHSFGMVRPNLPHSQALFPGFGHNLENPLQRMASITNSLVSQPLPSPQFSQKPLKAVLPPITQQQFDQYAHLNTDDLTRRTKELLSQYSISQRLFGEAVLGLSQGSVSDLLARPKPWHMLTQKGREPFIRMKIFLEDETAIHKLVSSQYKIVPDKLLRTGAYSGPQMSPHNKLTTVSPGARMPGLAGMDPFRAMAESPLPSLLSTSPRLPTQLLQGARPPLLPPLPHLTPNLYEVAALTQEFDTTIITNKVKELLLANNIGQKLFGEAVLGLSQGSVSELFSKPKPWHMLSIKGREPFIRMQLWLTDPNNIEKLLAMKKLQDESKKRKRTYDDSFSGKSSPSDISDLYSNPGQPGSPENNESKKSRDNAGLDLSFKREDDDRDSDNDKEEDEERNDESDDGNGSKQSYQGNAGGRSRRKPAAPQWVNPIWSGDLEQENENKQDDSDDRTINGVCVVNSGLAQHFSQDNKMEED